MKPAENGTGTPYCVRPARYGNIEKAERVNFCSCVAVVVTKIRKEQRQTFCEA